MGKGQLEIEKALLRKESSRVAGERSKVDYPSPSAFADTSPQGARQIRININRNNPSPSTTELPLHKGA